MQGGFLGMVLAEWRKARGRGLAWAVLLFGLMHGFVAVGLLMAGRYFESTMGPEAAADHLTWLVSGEFAVSLAALPVNGLALLLLFAMVWAEDFSLGTIAMIFVRPVPRAQVFAAKLTVCVLTALASMSAALLCGLGLGLPLFGLEGDLTGIGADTPFIGWMGGADGLLSPMLGGVFTGAFVNLPIAGLAALLAALFRSPVLTLFGSVMVLLGDAGVAFATTVWSSFARGACAKEAKLTDPTLLETLPCAEAEIPERLHDLTLWASRGFLGKRGLPDFFSEAGEALLVTGLWSALFLGLALLFFTRRDVH